jgi:hypothetical protein
MAKKKAETKMPTTAEEMRLVRLELPASVHREFRMLAASEETHMALLARRIIVEYVERKAKEGRK